MSDEKNIYAVSACLLGENCKYNGSNNKNDKVIEFLRGKEYITICPEMSGGLPCPRDPSEIVITGGIRKVMSKTGADVTENFRLGAEYELNRAMKKGCTHAILKSRSPTCGIGRVYDGTFSGTVTDGHGISAEMFINSGIECVTEEDL